MSCNETTPKVVKLLGLTNDRETDKLSTAQLHLDPMANTKRKILLTIASNFDLFQFAGSIQNRSRLFVHKLQCATDVSWDSEISESEKREWTCISKQVNGSSPIGIERFVGKGEGMYRLIVFTDASRLMLGTVVSRRCRQGKSAS